MADNCSHKVISMQDYTNFLSMQLSCAEENNRRYSPRDPREADQVRKSGPLSVVNEAVGESNTITLSIREHET